MANPTNRDLSKLLTERLEDISGYRSQREVADLMGLPNANHLSQIKTGKTNVDLARVRDLADAIDLPVEVVMKAALRQKYSDDVYEMLENHFSDLTKTEREIIKLARAVGYDTTKPLPKDVADKIASILAANKPSNHVGN